ncbi:acylphosphatase [Leifsonia sp. Root112D2]|uniref:acylphosphatase n=1 Tax=Leifsonia sp. Root112D2 TaxID=1736426 RepID=UPI0006F7F393|nr:acylphosphatase [Leifsonia sp. Root112D2]KQV08081.1 hypothetical protein ASC63_13115 [Leifsonia sp. Root112D2]
MIRRRIVVHGQVQGVGFRYSARQRASSLNLAGFVRNAPNGVVEAEIEGDEVAVQQMLDWLRHGPAWATVDALEVTECTPNDEHGFRIER